MCFDFDLYVYRMKDIYYLLFTILAMCIYQRLGGNKIRQSQGALRLACSPYFCNLSPQPLHLKGGADVSILLPQVVPIVAHNKSTLFPYNRWFLFSR